MIVVSDTTPLISLLKINRIDLMEKLFGAVMIPTAVFDELTADKRFQLEANQITQTKFIVVKPVTNPESASVLKRATGLDQGESEAIVLLSFSKNSFDSSSMAWSNLFLLVSFADLNASEIWRIICAVLA